MTLASWNEVVDFWFGAPASPEFGRDRGCWFEKSPVFDALVRDRFLETHEMAARGGLTAWAERPLAALALTIVLDQFPRNMFRGAPRAFATDATALALARAIVARGFDRALLPVQRWFAYLPFQHAEDLVAQRESLHLFAPLGASLSDTGALTYAMRHYTVIERFGRFPHRNAILGRSSTTEEVAFLSQPGSSF